MIQADGGDFELTGVDEAGIVRISLKGPCKSCTGSMMTLRQAIEQVVKERVPEVKEVVTVQV